MGFRAVDTILVGAVILFFIGFGLIGIGLSKGGPTGLAIFSPSNTSGQSPSGAAIAKTSESASPNVPSCVSNWQCGSWSGCSKSGTQTRSCLDGNSCGTNANKPSESQTCVYSCSSFWQCSEWSECSSSGSQTRSCTDSNTCGTTLNKPSTSQSCIYNPILLATLSIQNIDEYPVTSGNYSFSYIVDPTIQITNTGSTDITGIPYDAALDVTLSAQNGASQKINNIVFFNGNKSDMSTVVYIHSVPARNSIVGKLNYMSPIGLVGHYTLKVDLRKGTTIIATDSKDFDI